LNSRGGLGYIVSGWYIFVPPDGTLLLRRLQEEELEVQGVMSPGKPDVIIQCIDANRGVWMESGIFLMLNDPFLMDMT